MRGGLVASPRQRSGAFLHTVTQHETTLDPQRPYSPDLALADFFLFTKLKSLLKGRRFESVEEIK
jgi:hypothetical protein